MPQISTLELLNYKRFSSQISPENVPDSIYTVILSASENEENLVLPIIGGSQQGSFVFVDQEIDPHRFTYHPCLIDGTFSENKKPAILRPGDILIAVNDIKISGFTLYETHLLLKYFTTSNHSNKKARVKLSFLPFRAIATKSVQLVSYLKHFFPDCSFEKKLQEVIRENLYLRVIPFTTRPKRPEEVDGLHFTFISHSSFLKLQQSGDLIECGTYKGNKIFFAVSLLSGVLYGTPKPKDDPATAQELIQKVIKSCKKSFSQFRLDSEEAKLSNPLAFSLRNINPMEPPSSENSSHCNMVV
ncbi:Membrane-associated guanylate kinase, WW and PDZ domain-containing protein 2 [Cichlidogyrus casuarinus]|uniref:Membrane-associated guanylate kinase, WW and PDZ domain-containing protein 2 n=1 Tax=Cichlidogyrus casuarinus TaxID=1844966 RepID=A0ABD2Q117_9PLAT